MEQEFLHFKLWHLEDQGLDIRDVGTEEREAEMIKRKITGGESRGGHCLVGVD